MNEYDPQNPSDKTALVKHTPGPWLIEHRDDRHYYHVLYDVPGMGATLRRRIAEVPTWGSADGDANARLIAAAPDLLAACKELLLLIEEMMPGVRHIALQDYQRLNEAPIRAQTAIRRAEA